MFRVTNKGVLVSEHANLEDGVKAFVATIGSRDKIDVEKTVGACLNQWESFQWGKVRIEKLGDQ